MRLKAKASRCVVLVLVATLVGVSLNLKAILRWTASHGDALDRHAGRGTIASGERCTRAFAVVFADVQDPLVMERAHALWNSLADVELPGGRSGCHVLAIVPRFRGLSLESPLRSIGYRVLALDSVAPSWMASGPWAQQALIGVGGRGLLALGALALEEYEEVIVLEQKMVILPGMFSEFLRARFSESRTKENGGEEDGTSRVTDERGFGFSYVESNATVPDRESDPEAEEDLEAPARVRGIRRAALVIGEGATGEANGWLPQSGLGNVTGVAAAHTSRDGGNARSRRRRDDTPRGSSREIRIRSVPGEDAAWEGGHRRGLQGFIPRALGLRALFGRSEVPGTVQSGRRVSTMKAGRDSWGSRGGGGGRRRKMAAGSMEEMLPWSSGTMEDDWDVAFAPGENWLLTPKTYLAHIDKETRERITRWHAGLMIVRPSLAVYREVQSLLTQEDEVIESAYASWLTKAGSPRGGARDNIVFRRKRSAQLETVAPSAPLLHLALASAARPAILPLVPCGSTTSGDSMEEVASAEGVPLAWCLAKEMREGIVSGRDGVPGARRKLPTEKVPGGDGDAGGVVGIDAVRETPSAGRDLARLGVGRRKAREERAEEEPVMAWVPGDPCRCVEDPGMLGKACRSWVQAAKNSNEVDPAGGSCKGEVFDHPREVPSIAEHDGLAQVAFFVASAEAPAGPASGSGERKPDGSGGGVGVEEEKAERKVPPPRWQKRPERNVTVTGKDLVSFQHFWLINEREKFLMVAIPKVACTQFHALFLRMQDSEKWDTTMLANIHMHKDQHKYTMKTVAGITPERATEIMNDPSWTRGVFLRDPAERLLSCFLDKIVHRRSYSVDMFKSDGILSFERFVQLISTDAKKRFGGQYNEVQLGLSRRSNPHWRPQLYFGLNKFLPYFDFVGDFKHAQEHSEELLRHAGLWERYGESGWGPQGINAFFQRSTVQGHSTGSSSSKAMYYSLELLQRVREAYKATDYRLLERLGWWNESASSL